MVGEFVGFLAFGLLRSCRAPTNPGCGRQGGKGFAEVLRSVRTRRWNRRKRPSSPGGGSSEVGSLLSIFKAPNLGAKPEQAPKRKVYGEATVLFLCASYKVFR